MLFNIGAACKYNVPIEFGGMFMSARNEEVRKYNSKGSNLPPFFAYGGIRVNFLKKIVKLPTKMKQNMQLEQK